MKKTPLFLLLAVLTLLVAACNGNETDIEKAQDDSSDQLNIYTTVYPLSYFAERIGGDFVKVSSIYPPGSNEHSFEPTQQDMMNLADADLFFYIGLGLEGFVESAQKTLQNENVKLVATANSISDEKLDAASGEHSHEEDGHGVHDDHDHGDIDPHVWLSPVLAQDLALSIKEELVAELPEQETVFNDNYEQLVSELNALDEQFEKMATEAASKTFFVSHASFGYIANQYGLEQVAIAGINSQNEPSQKELTEIVDQAEALQVSYILFEQNVSSKLSTVIQNEVGAQSLELHNLSVLTEQDIQNDETYFSLMEKNIETLQQALN